MKSFIDKIHLKKLKILINFVAIALLLITIISMYGNHYGLAEKFAIYSFYSIVISLLIGEFSYEE